MQQRREPGANDTYRVCRCGADVFNPLLEPRDHAYEVTTGQRHSCRALRERIRDPFECNCGIVVYGQDGRKYAGPIGLVLHQCAVVVPATPPSSPRQRRSEWIQVERP